MNCDQAFDRMTDLTMLSDPALERHLADCPRCRQMRQTLAPALDAFSVQTFSPARSDESQAVQVAQEAAVALEKATAGRSRRRWPVWGAAAGLAGAIVAGALFAIGAFADNQSTDGTAPLTRGTDVAACTWVQKDQERRDDARTVVLSCVACHLAESPR